MSMIQYRNCNEFNNHISYSISLSNISIITYKKSYMIISHYLACFPATYTCAIFLSSPKKKHVKLHYAQISFHIGWGGKGRYQNAFNKGL